MVELTWDHGKTSGHYSHGSFMGVMVVLWYCEVGVIVYGGGWEF